MLIYNIQSYLPESLFISSISSVSPPSLLSTMLWMSFNVTDLPLAWFMCCCISFLLAFILSINFTSAFALLSTTLCLGRCLNVLCWEKWQCNNQSHKTILQRHVLDECLLNGNGLMHDQSFKGKFKAGKF